MLRIPPDLSTREVFARGLRNTIGFDWHPATHEMWGFDQGSDWMGNDNPPEELNRLVANGDYGPTHRDWEYEQQDLSFSGPTTTKVTGAEAKTADGKSAIQHHSDLFLLTESKSAAVLTKLMGQSASKLAEQGLGQLQLFFAGVSWYIHRHPEQAEELLK